MKKTLNILALVSILSLGFTGCATNSGGTSQPAISATDLKDTAETATVLTLSAKPQYCPAFQLASTTLTGLAANGGLSATNFLSVLQSANFGLAKNDAILAVVVQDLTDQSARFAALNQSGTSSNFQAAIQAIALGFTTGTQLSCK